MKEFVFTFGGNHKLKGKAQVITAETEIKAREIMHKHYGSKWCSMYTMSKWKEMEANPDRHYPMEKFLPDILDKNSKPLMNAGRTYKIGTGTGGLFFTKDNKLLLLKRADKPLDGLSWSLPGGHIEEFETSENCLMRECEEEIGRKIKIISEFGVVDHICHEQQIHYVSPVFVCEIQGGNHESTIIELSKEHTDYGWFDLNFLPSPLTSYMDCILEKLRKKTYVIETVGTKTKLSSIDIHGELKYIKWVGKAELDKLHLEEKIKKIRLIRM